MKTYKPYNHRMRVSQRKPKFRDIIILIILLFVVTSSLELFFNVNFKFGIKRDELDINQNETNFDLQPSAGIELFQDPFTMNFEDMLQFFNNKYQTDLNYQVDTYFRKGNNSGVITDDTVYPVDTILLYNTLLQDGLTETETFSNYLALKGTPFWYDNGGFNYGFISSLDNSTNKVIDDRRSLIDNLMAITMLIDNIGDKINTINEGGIYPKDSIEEIFNLVNSSQFWDSTNNGFSQYNSSDFTENKFTKSNLYAILTNLQIRNLYQKLNLNPEIKNRAYMLANQTMDTLLINMWDDIDDGFYYNAKPDWDTTGLSGSTYKYLDVNALGIITLIEYWLETGKNDGSLIDKAIATFDKINNNLYNESEGTFTGYNYYKDSAWQWGSTGQNLRIELESNSLMMFACLKLFEVTGNFTYYQTAFQLHQSFETNFYNNNAYIQSIYSPVNDDKHLNANLKLVDSYIKAFEVYNRSSLKSSFNVTTEIPDFIFDEDTLHIESNYYLINPVLYYNYSTQDYEIFQTHYNITSADISYILKYPNQTVFDIKEQVITGNSITFEYDINQSIPIGNGFSLYMYSNNSYFATAQVLKKFNVISGLKDFPILGLPSTLYQGPTFNITLPINNTRKEDINLTVLMEGDDIFEASQLKLFPTSVLTNVSFNLIAKLGASIGLQNISFTFKDGDYVFLKVIKTINFGYSIDYEDFLYQNRVVSGDTVEILFNLVNFLPNTTQSCNISFSGEHIQNFKQEINLEENEVRALYYDIWTHSDIIEDTIEIKFEILKGNTILYSKLLEIEVVPRFEILSVSFPAKVRQGEEATFILVINNNREVSETYTMLVNGKILSSGGLAPGENRIQVDVLPTLFPYDFFDKFYKFEILDTSENLIAKYYYKISIEVSPSNIILFYVLPIIIPIGIILFYKNKELKHKQLKR